MANQFVSVPRDCLPEYDEVHVVSDLHLGGETGFQIFNSGRELAWLIRHLRDSPAGRLALVINGDFVDFLAEQPSRYFDPADAARKLTRITEDEAFRDVFAALSQFVAAENRFLVINLGNHDLELALPWVRAHLLRLLACTDDAARGRITLSLDGTGFACIVGGSEVLCVHGNEVDTWNVADYEAIRQIAQEIVHGREVESWVPNAGTKMVIEVMNDVKKQFPFVDLLKPETSGVLPILSTLAPLQVSKLHAASAIVARLGLDKLKRLTGFLGAGDEEQPAPGTLASLPNLDAAASGGAASGGAYAPNARRLSDLDRLAERLLDETERMLAEGVEPLALVAGEHRGARLGVMQGFMLWLKSGDKYEAVREALEKLRFDRSFEFDQTDKTFEWLDEQVKSNAEFLIAGHTHLERALPRRHGIGTYFNSGTWARLIKLEQKVLEDADLFKKVYDALAAGSMQKLDDFAEGDFRLVLYRLTVVSVFTQDGRAYGELRRVEEEEDGELLLNPVEKSRFPNH